MASSKPAYLLAALLLAGMPAPRAHAEAGVITTTGVGRESGDAIANLLKNTVARHFKEHPAALVRTVLANEILPNASSFVQSYRIVEGGRNGAVTLSASVDLDVIQGLLSLTPKNLGEAEGAKALVFVRGAKLPDGVLNAKGATGPADPYAVLELAGKERFARRGFTEVLLKPEDLASLGGTEELAGVEALRGLALKAGARVALGITSKYETYENENSHSKEERIVVTVTLLDVKTGAVLGKSQGHVAAPKGRRDQYAADLQRALIEESKDLFQDAFVAAGRRSARTDARAEYSIVRVDSPPSAALVARFRSMLEGVSGVKSVVEHSIRRGAFDFAVRPALDEAALAKAVAGMQAPDLIVAPLAAGEPREGEPRPTLTVRIAPKEAAPSETGAPAGGGNVAR